MFFCQAKLRLEMEMERLRQTHSKEIESKDDEVEDIRQSCSKKVKEVITLMRTNTFSSCCFTGEAPLGVLVVKASVQCFLEGVDLPSSHKLYFYSFWGKCAMLVISF